jgi:hypothetical protein
MAILMPEQKQFEKAPSGTHVATCYQILDLGSQINDFGKADERKVQRQIRIVWELPNALMEDGRPFTIGKTYTLSSFEGSNLVKDINAWRGKPFTPAEFGAFDIEKLIGKSCLLQVTHPVSKAGKAYAKVNAIMALPSGQQSAKLINNTLTFSLSTFDKTAFESLPDYWRNVISSSPEYRELVGGDDTHNNEPVPELSEDIPF